VVSLDHSATADDSEPQALRRCLTSGHVLSMRPA
jgi:hypothetical protein